MKTYILMLLALLFALPYMAEARSRYYSDSYYDSYYDRGYGYYDRDEDYGYYDDGYYEDYRPRRVVHHKKKAVSHKKAKAKIVKAKIKKSKTVVVNKPVVIKEAAPIETKVAPVAPVINVSKDTVQPIQLQPKSDVIVKNNSAAEELNQILIPQQFKTYPKHFTGTGKQTFPAGYGNPTFDLRAGKCNIKFDCPNERVTINGQNYGGIVCAGNKVHHPTAGSTDWKKTNYVGQILMAKTVEHNMMTPYHLSNQGAGVPWGVPMLKTKPSLCPACYIHQFPATHFKPDFNGRYVRNPFSAGCVGVSAEAWEELNHCGGSKFVVIPKGMSKRQSDMVVASYEHNYAPMGEPAIASASKSIDKTETATIPPILSGTAR